MAKTKKKQSKAWFVARRGSYLPVSGKGLTIYLLYVAYLVALFAGWYHKGHLTWDFLIAVLPLSVGSAILTQFIASRRAK